MILHWSSQNTLHRIVKQYLTRLRALHREHDGVRTQKHGLSETDGGVNTDLGKESVDVVLCRNHDHSHNLQQAGRIVRLTTNSTTTYPKAEQLQANQLVSVQYFVTS